jgi:hypothetical protein
LLASKMISTDARVKAFIQVSNGKQGKWQFNRAFKEKTFYLKNKNSNLK